MSEFASDSGHWYAKDGSPAYEVPMAKDPSKMRNTTLSDAKKLGLLPSVTTVMKEAAKPGLTNWIINQNVMAALTVPRIDGELDEDFIKRISADATEQAKQAREKGTHIHGIIEKGFLGHLFMPEEEPYYLLAKEEIEKNFPKTEFTPEKSFANTEYGYGGKIDLSPNPVIDIKTNEKPVAEAKLWDDHYMQLAAYIKGLGKEFKNTDAGILFINHKDMEARFVFAEDNKLERGWEMFKSLLDYWYAKSGLQKD